MARESTPSRCCIINSQVHCILMRLMVGRVKLRLSVLHSICYRQNVPIQSFIIMVNLFNCYGVLTRGRHFKDFAKSHHNLTYQTDKNAVGEMILFNLT